MQTQPESHLRTHQTLRFSLVVVGAALAVTSLTALTNPVDAKPKTTKPSSANGVDPNAPEVVSPGDIPDNQVFVTYSAGPGTYKISVPEGWSRTDNKGLVVFTDHYNSIGVSTSKEAKPPTVGSVKSSGLQDVSIDPTFRLGSVVTTKRTGGTAIRATFEIGSAPNSVTGKKALLAVERYFFFRAGRTLILTLSGAKGADNVDPWRIVSNSVRIG